MSIYGNTIMVGSASGGGAKQMFQVKLPPSVYYESASEWVEQTVEQPQGTGMQCVVNGQLWVVPGNGTAYALDLNTGSIVDSFADRKLSFAMDNCSFCNDGERRAWIVYPSRSPVTTTGYSDPTGAFSLLQIDFVEKTVTSLGECCTYRVTLGGKMDDYRNFSIKWQGALPVVYSKVNNGVFVFGAKVLYTYYDEIYRRTQVKAQGNFYDLGKSAFTKANNSPIVSIYGFGWEDPNTGEIYFGSGVDKNYSRTSDYQTTTTQTKTIYKYNLTSGAFTAIKTDFSPAELSTNSDGGWFPLGDTVLFIGRNVCLPFDPKTGETRPGTVPTNPGILVYFGYSGVYQNTLYISGAEKFIKCALYEELPANAPIVAKIYKGNKYHSTVPFSIPGKLEVKTTQQIADSDIEIKMYEYDAAGGQTLYIET